MEKTKKEDFELWIKECNWKKINEVGTTDGQQDTYLTPAGKIIIIQYDIEGNLHSVIEPMPAMPQAKSMGSFPIDFRGGGKLPGMPQG